MKVFKNATLLKLEILDENQHVKSSYSKGS
jgi:hypothetical protein